MRIQLLFVFPILLSLAACVFATDADWTEPRHDKHLTAIQPVPGAIKPAPKVIAQIDLGRVAPNPTLVNSLDNQPKIWIAIIGGALHAYDASGKPIWTSHPPGMNFTAIIGTGDFDHDGESEIALQAGRSAAPFGAAILVSAKDGKILWRYDVEPMSYAWYFHIIDGPTPADPKEFVVIMHGYPPDPQNGYTVLFHHTPSGWQQKWRYDFSQYTCFPNMIETDLDGDGVKELCIISHSRMWALDRNTGAVKQFLEWDTSPANHRSYGLNLFVDLNGDHKPDFLCLGYFSKHYDVLLNDNGKLKEAWHIGWDDSVTTGIIGLTWPLPPYGDVDGDGKMDVVVSVFDGDGEGKWAIRVHDAVTGKLKYKLPGMIAARLVDMDGDGKCEILADRSDEGSDVRTYGDYAIQHPKSAAILKVIDGKLQPIWQKENAVAIREENGPVRVRVGKEDLSLSVTKDDKVTESKRTALRAPPSNAPKLPHDAPAHPMPELLAADVMGEGSNQLIVFGEGKATISRFSAGKFEQIASFPTTCLPVISDLDGDGKLELVLADIADNHPPRFKAITPALGNKTLWESELPLPTHAGLPAPRIAYMRTGRFLGRKGDDLYIWAGIPQVRSVVLNGATGKLVWEKDKFAETERYYGPSTNLASVADFNHDGKEDLVFTNPDMYCIASGDSGNMLLGPIEQMKIFNQPSQGLYTMPAILGEGADATVCLMGGHYYRAALSLDAKPKWYALPRPGEARCANEGFLRTRDGKWLMGYGRQDGKFSCLNMTDGSPRWMLDVQSSCSDTTACDIDGDGNEELIFGTSHGALYAVGDDNGNPRVVWKVETGVGLGNPILADIDGDGKTDVIIAGEDGRVRVFGVAK